MSTGVDSAMMIFPRKASLLLLLVAFLVVVACAEATQVPTATPVATPVSTATPVATAVPTATPVPATAVPRAATAPPSIPPVPPASVEPATVKRTEPCPTPQEWDYIGWVNSLENELISASRVLRDRTRGGYPTEADVHSYRRSIDDVAAMQPPPSMQHIQVAMEQFADRLRVSVDAFEQAVANESPTEVDEWLEQDQAIWTTTAGRVEDLIRNFCPDDVERTERCPNDLESNYIVIVTSRMNPLRAAAGHARGRAERALVLEWDFSEYRVESEILSYRQNIDVVAGIEPPPSMQHIQDDLVQFADRLRVSVDAFEQAVVNESPTEVAAALEQEQAAWDTEDQVVDQFRGFCP